MTQMTIQQALELAWRQRQAGQLGEAEAITRQVLAAFPGNSDAHSILGVLLHQQGRFDEAINHAKAAIDAFPKAAAYYCRLGASYLSTNRLNEAIEIYRRGLAIDPNFVDLHNDLGNALKQSGQPDAAIAAYQRAVALAPDNPVPHNNLGLMYLLRGDFERGFPEYAWRAKAVKLFEQQFPQPRWDGSDLNGRTLLVRAEQGMGDAIQFCRYIPLLAQRGARVLFAIKPPLVRLMRTLEGPAALLTQGDALIPFDVHTTLLELPHLLHTTLATIPVAAPYLRADPVLAQQWAQRLSNLKGRKVGLVWAGAREHQNDRNRSMSLKMLEPLLRTSGISWVSLQKDRAAEELKSLPPDLQIMDCGAELNDFADTAALMQNLDLLISVDTAPIHLFGAMGKPTWVLLPFMPDWRWMLNRSDSPWYPTMKLFRQPAPGDWNTPLEQIARELQ